MTFFEYLDQTWIIGRRRTDFYIRFYPNPGFMFTFKKKQYVWSKFYGWKVRNAANM